MAKVYVIVDVCSGVVENVRVYGKEKYAEAAHVSELDAIFVGDPNYPADSYDAKAEYARECASEMEDVSQLFEIDVE